MTVMACYQVWQTAGPRLPTAAASDVGDDAVSCVHLWDSAVQYRRQAGLANVHDGDLSYDTYTLDCCSVTIHYCTGDIGHKQQIYNL